MEYQNFDLWIQRAGSRYKVSVIPPNGVEGFLCDEILNSKMQRDLVRLEKSLPDSGDDEQLRSDFEQIISDPVNGEFLKEVGHSLYQCLFREAIRDEFKERFGTVSDDDEGLRIRLIIEPAEIARLPWELMYDRSRDRFLSAWDKTSIVRYPNMPEMKRRLKVNWPIKVLVAISDYKGEEQLASEKEKEIITKAFKDLEAKGFVRLDFLEGRVSVATITEKLDEDDYHIFHFIGHGCIREDQGYLKISFGNEDDPSNDNQSDRSWLRADRFANLFANHGTMKLVVLNSCQGAQVSSTRPFSGVAPQLFRRDIPAVVAMQYPILDDSARTFAQKFYHSLCKGRYRGLLDVAIIHARNRMLIERSEDVDFATPVLFMRTSSGLIFDLSQEPQRISGITLGPQGGPAVMEMLPLSKLYQPIALSNEVPRLKALKIAREENLIALNNAKETAATEEDRQMVEVEIESEKQEFRSVERRITKAKRISTVLIVSTLLMGCLLLLATVAGLFNVVGVGDYLNWFLHNRISRAGSGTEGSGYRNMSLILVDSTQAANGFLHPDEPILDRGYHADLIDALANAGAKVVAMDVVLKTNTSPFDSKLAASIVNAKTKGTSVLFGVELKDDGQPSANPPEVLDTALADHLGNVNIGLDYELQLLGLEGFRPVIRHVELAKENKGEQAPEGFVPVYPSLMLQAVRFFHSSSGANLPRFYLNPSTNPQRLMLVSTNGEVVESVPVVDDEMSFTVSPDNDSEFASIRQSYQDVYARRNDSEFMRSKFQDKLVWVGYGVERERYYVTGTHSRYGVEIHANTVANIFQKVYIRNVPWFVNLVIILGMLLIGILLQLPPLDRLSYHLPIEVRVMKRILRVPIGLLLTTVIYFVVVWFAYSRSNYMIDMTYHVSALFVGYVLGAYPAYKSKVTKELSS